MALCLILASCANIKPRTGGEKDTTAPIDTVYKPLNLTTSFTGNQFSITFDEYVQLKDVNNQLIVSPPLEKRPEIKVKNKTLTVSWDEELKANTTYSFNFGEAIADYNEGNIARGIQYVFSTGTFIDSLGIAGRVLDAYTLKPVPNCKILVHNILADSSLQTNRPYYFSITNNEGAYSVGYMKPGTYAVYALNDENQNFVLDAGEALGFRDSEVTLSDSSIVLSDFMLSTPPETTQYIQDYSRDSTGFVRFQLAVEPDSLGFEVIGHPEAQWTQYVDQQSDSTYFWLLGDEYNSELDLRVFAAGGLDDTINIQSFEVPERPFRVEPAQKGKVNGRDTLYFKSSRWLELDSTAFHGLFRDSLAIPFQMGRDEDPREYWIHASLEDGATYRWETHPGFLRSREGWSTDTIRIDISTHATDHYGSITLLLQEFRTDIPLILEVESKNGNVVRREFVKDERVNLGRLVPAQYTLRLIEDLNQNGQWDSGNFEKHIQPEPIHYLPQVVNLRSNWEMEFTWIVNKME